MSALISRVNAGFFRKVAASKKPTVAGRKQSIKTKQKKQSSGKETGTDLHSIVFPPKAEMDLTKDQVKNLEFLKIAWEKYQFERYHRKSTELTKMRAKMTDALEQLEKLDPRLYRMAMIKDYGKYFPIERRFMTDNLPSNGWNHENLINPNRQTR